MDSSDIFFELIDSGDWDFPVLIYQIMDQDFIVIQTTHSSDIVSVLWESDLISDPISNSWELETRLSSGTHNISISINDGHGKMSQTYYYYNIGVSTNY